MNTQILYLDRARNELTEHLVYHKLALHEKNQKNRALLETLSLQEKAHYHEFGESASLILGTALASYILGEIVGKTFHINATSF